ncbi:hypothetical protein B0H13DRAFT_1718154 [Mycena leptocephala]|nr:hypothetical protein B0H13DRAFT_1718154 [Mycena leptocephala]
MPEDPFLTSPRKTPSMANRRSTASLRPSTMGGETGGGMGGGFSLAHELAVAMMPEPSAGSKLLAEEFGIEFDEGAEGIDAVPTGPQINIQDGEISFAESESDPQLDSTFDSEEPSLDDPTFGDPQQAQREEKPKKEVDAMEVLAADLASTDNFLLHLRRLDADSLPPSSTSSSMPSTLSSSTLPSSSSIPTSSSSANTSQQPELERLASDVIRRINDTARDREGQVRALLEYEREFRRIAGEVGGQDVLGRLDALPIPEEDEPDLEPELLPPSLASSLSPITEVETVSPKIAPTRPPHVRTFSQDWETDPDAQRLGDALGNSIGDLDGDDGMDPAFANTSPPASPSASRTAFSLSPSIPAAAPPAALAPNSASSAAAPSSLGQRGAAQLSDLRTLTTSLIASLTSVSEHAQVNGAATAEAGRKLRALRNRLGGWRAEWEGAERSRGRIERWEAGGVVDFSSTSGTPVAGVTGANTPVGGGDGSAPPTPIRSVGGGKRIDGRTVVAEHLSAFERALADAAVKTKAIMAVS